MPDQLAQLTSRQSLLQFQIYPGHLSSAHVAQVIAHRSPIHLSVYATPCLFHHVERRWTYHPTSWYDSSSFLGNTKIIGFGRVEQFDQLGM